MLYTVGLKALGCLNFNKRLTYDNLKYGGYEPKIAFDVCSWIKINLF